MSNSATPLCVFTEMYTCSGSLLNSAWFALDTSRGHESAESQVFMRATVLVSDLLVYFPAVVFFVRAWHSNRSRRTQVSDIGVDEK